MAIDFNDRDEFDDADSDWDDEDDPYGDCAMGADGLCGKAGSAECDFECPVMADIIRREEAKKESRKP